MKTAVKLFLWHVLMPGTLILGAPPSAEKYKQSQSNLQSPRLIRLAQEFVTVGPEALKTFREEIQRQGTPLIEPISKDETHFWVTFLWFAREPVQNVVVFS